VKERIKKLRKTLRLSQDAFGGRIGVTQVAVSKWESGESQPDTRTLKLIAGEFGVDHNWLMTGSGEMMRSAEGKPKEDSATDVLTRFVALLERMQDRLDDEKKELYKMIEEQRDDKAVLKSILKKHKIVA